MMLKYLSICLLLVSHYSVVCQEVNKDGKYLFFQQEYHKAIPVLETEFAFDSSVFTAGYLLSAYFLTGKFTKIKELAETVLSKDSLHIQANLRIAQLKEMEGRLPEAGIYYERLISAQPGHAYYYKLIGLNYLKQQDDIQAFQWLSQAYAMAPDDIELIIHLAELFTAQKQYTEADQLISVGLKLYPRHLKLNVMQAEVCYSDRYYTHTIDLLKDMHREGQFNNYLRRMMAACYIQIKDFDKALMVLKEIEDPDNNEEYTYLYLHKAYYGLGDLIMARHYIQKCIEACKHPNAGKYYGFLGNVLIDAGMFTQAAEQYVMASGETGDTQLLFLAARAYDAAESFSKAKLFYASFIRMSKDQEGYESEIEFANNRIEKLKAY
jgi:tetratricopeptide (TPR) repeat protein